LKRLLVFAAIALVLTGCANYAPQRYTAVPGNVATIRELPAVKVRIDRVSLATAFDTSCRGAGMIDPPVGMSFADYVRGALTDELQVAGYYSTAAPQFVLHGEIDEISFQSISGEWRLGLKMRSSNGRSMRVAERFPYESSFNGETACKRAAEAFLPAVQNLISKLIRDPNFPALLRI